MHQESAGNMYHQKHVQPDQISTLKSLNIAILQCKKYQTGLDTDLELRTYTRVYEEYACQKYLER